MMRIPILIYIVAITTAEAIGATVGAVPGIICHAIIIPILLSHYVLTNQALDSRMLPILALAPLLRILSLTIPMPNVPSVFWPGLMGVPMFVAIVMTARVLGLSVEQLKLGAVSWKVQLIIASTGAPLGIMAFLIIRPNLAIGGLNWYVFAFGALLLTLFLGFTEELMFRGLLQTIANESFGWGGILVSSGLMAAMYIVTLSPLYILLILLAGCFFGYWVDRTRSIRGVALANGIAKIGLAVVMPYANARYPEITTELRPPILFISAVYLAIACGVLPFCADFTQRLPQAETSRATAIRLSRLRAGLSYIDLAQRTGLPARFIAEVELNVRPLSPEQLRVIQQALNIP